MNETDARQHALGYAAGREDASNERTANPYGEGTGFMEFAAVFAQGWADYNAERRGMMVNAKEAYNTWQETRGRTIFPDDVRRAVVARSVIGRPDDATVAAYMPHNYVVTGMTSDEVSIAGHDVAGWTLDDYVIPRLASGMITAREVGR